MGVEDGGRVAKGGGDNSKREDMGAGDDDE